MSREVPDGADSGSKVKSLMAAERAAELGRLEKAVVEVADRESRRLGKELHDTLCQQMLGAAFCTKALAKQCSADSVLSDRLQELASLINSAVQQTRCFNHGTDLASGQTDLVKALQDLLDAPRRGMKATLECSSPATAMRPETGLQLYRIAHEALANAVEHSGGSRVIVRLSESDSQVFLEVEDDGRGSPETLDSSTGIGIKLMGMRARFISAKLSFLPAGESGIRVQCVAPK